MNNLKVDAITSFSSKKILSQKPKAKTADDLTSSKNSGKKIALALAGLGALAVAGVAIAGKIRKRGLDGADIQRIASSGDDNKVIGNIAKFFNLKGEEVSNIQFDNGIAKTENGFFTGILRRMVNGKELNIEYMDGRAVKTVIDGVTKKEFYYDLASDGALEKVYISKFDKNGQVISERTNIFDSYGFLSRVLIEKPGNGSEKAAEVIDFRRLDYLKMQGFTDKQARKAIISGKINYSDINQGKVEKVELFDFDGNVIKVLQPSGYYKDGNYFEVVEKMPDGTRKIIDTWNTGVAGNTETVPAQEIIGNMSNPAIIKRIAYEDADGRLTKDIEFDYNGSFTRTLYSPEGKVMSCFSFNPAVQDKPLSFDLIKEDETTIWTGFYPQAESAKDKTFAWVEGANEPKREAVKAEIHEVLVAYNTALKEITDEGLLSKIDIKKISNAIVAIMGFKQ